ncbi:MAG: hypothetical protein PUA56_02520 [Bacillales bacterium]|nr:hypothetical protein [Bacillales bacterium]
MKKIDKDLLKPLEDYYNEISNDNTYFMEVIFGPMEEMGLIEMRFDVDQYKKYCKERRKLFPFRKRIK